MNDTRYIVDATFEVEIVQHGMSKQTRKEESEFRRCDGCHAERMCWPFENVWLCKGPNKCWRKRREIAALKKRGGAYHD